MKKLCFVLCSALVFASCGDTAGTKEAAAPAFSLDSAKADIDANNAAFVAAMKKGDSVAVAASYTKDGCMMPANMPKFCGTQALTSLFNGMYQMGIRNLTLTVTEVIGNADLVSEEGTYEMFTNEGASMEKGKYIVTWKKEDGKWKKYRDIFNSDMPAPPPPPMVKK